jgi:hypothetical protein
MIYSTTAKDLEFHSKERFMKRPDGISTQGDQLPSQLDIPSSRADNDPTVWATTNMGLAQGRHSANTTRLGATE